MTELLVDCAAVAAGVVQRVFRLPVLPRVVPAAVAALELERELRRPLMRRIGPIQTDLLLSPAPPSTDCAPAAACPPSTP
ncbi:hypothetical protein ACIBJF_06350 [Streptomyces sp. NPDC050743]|uniref:hypothetical protein n=1 Tax=Streptomyces sp. NPDC050743 TaxID=3365634 RepID=UPI0037BA0421